MDPAKRIKQIDKEILKVSIIDMPGTMMLGLGLYAKFADDAGAFHPILDNPTVVNTMLVVGAAIMAWGGYQVLTLSKEKAKLKNRYNL